MNKNIEPSLDEELLRLLSSQAAHSPVAVIVSMGIIAYMAFQQAPQLVWLWVGWLGVVAAAQFARVVILRRLPGHTHLDPRDTLRAAALVNVCNTVVHSISLVFFPLFTPFQAAVQSMLFIGMGVASTVTAMGYSAFALAHICLGLLPLFGLWAWSGMAGPAGPMGLLIAAVGAAYMITLYSISRRIFALFEESHGNRSRLREALSTAEVAGNAKTRFLAAASHDLRQPIHTLSLLAAALGFRNLDPQARQIANSIDEAVRALAQQLDALLDISKLDAGIVPVKRSSFRLGLLLQRLEEDFKALAEEKNIEITVRCPDGAVVRTDSALLERIVRNLLSNAIAHNEACQIQLVASRREDRWQLSIADTGVGIPEAEQGRIFEEFYQVNNPGRDRSRGLGLGLAIVQRLSGLLDLQLEFESSAGWGTRFTLQLVPDQLAEPSRPEEPGQSLEGLNILVVDDESAVREGMKTLLQVLGCEVQTAASTSAALSCATGSKPDLALVDFRLRDHDSGLSTIERLRNLYPGLPAIIVSGDTAPDRLRQAEEAGIPVLGKPVLVEPLKNMISQVCYAPGREDINSPAPVA